MADLFAIKPNYKSELLVKSGFIQPDKKENYRFNEKKNEWEPVGGYKFNTDDALEEEKEILKTQYGRTGYPPPLKFYTLAWEAFDLSLEEPYFWVLDTLKENFPIIEKLEDSFAAAENSAFFGVTQQRLGAQQDRVSQFLATIGKMIKELFQLVRELRIIDERLGYYRGVQGELKKPLVQRRKGDEITLKGFFVDLVQQGAKSPASVFGMARELEFITLPDLFFDAPPFENKDEVEVYVNDLAKSFNRNVTRVLVRHLIQYMEWRSRTHQEHETRRRFQLAYLRQHFDIIRMYVNWIKPYLRHVSRLHLKESRMTTADLISSFEGSMLDIEVLARKKSGSGYECILASFHYRTRPEMKVVQEGYQRGPVHVGRFEMNLRVYGWTEEQVNDYKRLKEKETMFLMGEVSESVQKAMESLGTELETYYHEASGQGKEEQTEKEAPEKTLMQRMLGDFYTPKKAKKMLKKPFKKKESDGDIMVFIAKGVAWGAYHNFKKAHRMVAW